MKKLHLVTLLLFFAFNTHLFAQKQSLANDLISNYEGKKGYTTITISPSLFKMLASIKTTDPDYNKIKKLADKLERIKIIIQNDEKDNLFQQDISNFMSSLKSKGYEELISITEEGDKISFVTLQKDEKSKELLMSILGEESILMLIDGDFTVDEIIEISRDVKFTGIEKLNQKNL